MKRSAKHWFKFLDTLVREHGDHGQFMVKDEEIAQARDEYKRSGGVPPTLIRARKARKRK